MQKYHIIIIGAGMGGLTCGCYLAKAGLKVLIVEQHYKAGGYCTSFKRDSFRFDVGVHYLGGLKRPFLKDIFEELEVSEKIHFKQFDPTDKIIMPDRVMYIRSNPLQTIEEFKTIFPEQRENIDKFFRFIMQDNFYEIYQKIRRLNFQEVLDGFFQDHRLKATLEILLCNFGLAARKAAALTAVILYRDYILDGGYYPAGGMQALADAFVAKFKAYGGRLLLRRKVEQILVRGGKIDGLILDDESIVKADIVVSNADAAQTFKKLLNGYNCKEYLYIDKLAVSPSAFVVYIGTEQKLEQFTNETCNIWSAATYQFGHSISDLDKSILAASPPFVIISFPSAHSDDSGSNGKNTIQVFTIAPFKSISFWNNYRADFTAKLINRAQQILPGLKPPIKVQISATPFTFFKYTLNRDGAAFGWASTVNQLHPVFFSTRTSIRGLFFTGHWCRINMTPGGVAKAIFSGKKTFQSILNWGKVMSRK